MIRQRNQEVSVDPNAFLASILSAVIVWCLGTAFAQTVTRVIEDSVEKKSSSR